MATKMSDIGTFIIQKVKYYPVTLLFVIITWYLSFFTPPKTELDEVAFIDKWVHVAMYGGTFGTLWIEYLRHHGGVLSKRTLSRFWALPAAWICTSTAPLSAIPRAHTTRQSLT